MNAWHHKSLKLASDAWSSHLGEDWVEAQDDWSPEAREAAAKARAKSGGVKSSEGHLHMHAAPKHGEGKKFTAKAHSQGHVNELWHNMKSHLGNNAVNYQGHVENKRTGEFHPMRFHTAPPIV